MDKAAEGKLHEILPRILQFLSANTRNSESLPSKEMLEASLCRSLSLALTVCSPVWEKNIISPLSLTFFVFLPNRTYIDAPDNSLCYNSSACTIHTCTYLWMLTLSALPCLVVFFPRLVSSDLRAECHIIPTPPFLFSWKSKAVTTENDLSSFSFTFQGSSHLPINQLLPL